jgi:hypothetical protein
LKSALIFAMPWLAGVEQGLPQQQQNQQNELQPGRKVAKAQG